MIDLLEIEEDLEEVKPFVLKACSQACLDNEVSCPFGECEHWISFDGDNNCDLIAIQKHGSLTLREVGERMGVSYVRIKQIEDAAIRKIRNSTTLDTFGD